MIYIHVCPCKCVDIQIILHFKQIQLKWRNRMGARNGTSAILKKRKKKNSHWSCVEAVPARLPYEINVYFFCLLNNDHPACTVSAHFVTFIMATFFIRLLNLLILFISHNIYTDGINLLYLWIGRRGLGKLRGAVTQSVERATPGEEVLGSIAGVATRSLLVGSVSV